MRLHLLASVIAFFPLNAVAQSCASVIALSKIRSTIVASASEVQSNVTQFCNEYSRNRSSSSSSRFGASYEFLSGTFSSGRASVDEVASRYCSAANNYAASSNAYQSYIEAIAPGAYAAYQSCILMQDNDVLFSIDEGSVLPRQFAMTVTFRQPGRETAQLTATPATGVSCRWASSSGPTISLRSPGTATLSCERNDASQKSFVTVAQDNGLRSIIVPWQAYSSEGVPLNALNALQSELAAVRGRLETVASQLNRLDIQGGTIALAAGPGSRPLLDGSRCVDDSNNSRGETRGRITFSRAFPSIPVVTGGISHLDVTGGRNLRINFRVISADATGFNYSFTTWCDTQVYAATAYWTAVSR